MQSYSDKLIRNIVVQVPTNFDLEKTDQILRYLRYFTCNIGLEWRVCNVQAIKKRATAILIKK
jgi:hypothetical protein